MATKALKADLVEPECLALSAKPFSEAEIRLFTRRAKRFALVQAANDLFEIWGEVQPENRQKEKQEERRHGNNG